MAWRMNPRDGCRLFIREFPGMKRRLYEYDSREGRVYRVRLKDGARLVPSWIGIRHLMNRARYREIIPPHLQVPEGL